MNLNTEQQKQLEDILTAICETLDISESQYNDAENKYNAVGKWLSRPNSPLCQYSPMIYPQGSIRIGTTIKPLDRDEFDLDIVCQMKISNKCDPNTLKEMVGKCLWENEQYRKILEPKNRCWRLNYAGAFHMDILPAIQDLVRSGTSILVPDKQLQEWKESNPIGYSDWFLERMKIAKSHLLYEQSRASVESLPINERFVKTPLQIVVQILKRHRDIQFSKDKDSAPISIVITTLAAKAYRNEYDLYSALFNIIDGMPLQIDEENGQPMVKNPVNPIENFAEKWEEDKRLLHVFEDWLRNLNIMLLNVPLTEGTPAINDALVPVFGEAITKAGINRYADKFQAKREGGRLYAAKRTAMVGSIGSSIPRNTFYGD